MPDLLWEILGKLTGVTGPDAQGWHTAFCPFHDDQRTPNLRLREKGFRCMTCGEKGGLKKLGQKLGITVGPLTVAEYAVAKKLPEAFLRTLGLTDGRTGMRIPYLGEDGNELAVRFRHSLVGVGRFSWKTGSKPVPYGLFKLTEARKAGYIILVEGESNCHTLWYHQLPALGIPGAATWRPAWASYLAGIPRVFLIQDPDEAGGRLAERLAVDTGDRLRIVRLNGVKDVSDLYVTETSAFPQRFQEALAMAQPYTAASGLDPQEVQEALALLRDSAILDRIGQDLETLGVVGEKTAGTILYLVGSSRKMKRPLGSAVRNPSSYGKTHLVAKVAALMPEDEVIQTSRLTPQALHYWEQGGLRGKWLVILDTATSESMGVARIVFSDGGLRVYYPAKDEAGNLATTMHQVEGPVAYADVGVMPLTDVQDSSRFLEIPLDGSQAQTERIQDRQRWEATLEGLRQRPQREAVTRRHQAAQRLLEPGIEVIVPFAPFIRFPSSLPRARRDLARFLNLIQAVAFLRQFQKTIQEEQGVRYIEADLEDYRLAYGLFLPLASAVLNDLNAHSLSLLEGIHTHYQPGDTFSRQDLVGKLNTRPAFVRDYIQPLVEGGFLEVVAAGGPGKPWIYKLAGRTPDVLAISTPEEVAQAVRLAQTVAGVEEFQPSTVNPSKSGG